MATESSAKSLKCEALIERNAFRSILPRPVTGMFERKLIIFGAQDALMSHPDVASTAVIGVPDPQWGEAVIVFVARSLPR